MKRNLMFMLTAMLSIGCFTSTAYAADFSDINEAPWEGAKTYINSVADSGLMVGDIHPVTGKKRFRPRDKVTYCETTQLAYVSLKNTNNLIPTTENLTTKWGQVLKSNNIPAWAYESVSYALENNIISLYDVSRFMTKNGSAITDNYASRESVAVIFGKALSHKYTVNQSAMLTYLDKASISSTSVPYVDLLSRLNILVGDTDNNFTPKTYINRAEMSVLVSKTYNTVNGAQTPTTPPTTPTTPTTPQGSTISGTVQSLESYGATNMLTVITTTGQKQGFMVDVTTYAIDATTADNKQISALSLTPGDGVTITYSGSQINLLKLTFDANPGSGASTVKGRIDEITNEKIYLNKSTGGDDFYYFAPSYTIKLDGDTVKQKDLFDACDEGHVDVEMTLDYSSKIIEIVATSVDKIDVKGTLKGIDKSEISVKKSGGTTKEYSWASDPVIKFQKKDYTINKLISEYNDKSQTIYVEVTLDSRDRVKKLVATLDKKDDEDIIVGTLVSLDRTEVEVKNSDNSNKRETYDLADDVTYKLNGKSSSRSDINDELKDGKVYVELTLDSRGDVEMIRTDTEDEFDSSSSSSSTKKTGTIKSMDKKEVKLGSTYYDMPDDVDDVTYKLDGKSSTYSKVKDKVSDSDYEVTATIYLNSRKEITKIDAETDDDSSSNYTGTKTGEIKKISKSSITLDKSSSTYDYAAAVSVSLDDDEDFELSDIISAFDDSRTFEAKLTIKKDLVTAIDVYTTGVEGTIDSVSSSKGKIYVDTDKEDSIGYEFDPDDVIVKIDGDTEDIDYLVERVKKYDYDVVLTLRDGVVTKIVADR